MKTKQTIRSQKVRETLKSKAVQMVDAAICGHCGVPYSKVNQHISVCIMNPDRKSRNGMSECPKCNFMVQGKNVDRHINSCDGDIADSAKAALQSFRVEYLRILRGGERINGRIDRSLGYGKRAVPEVVRLNAERDLYERGMPKGWTVAPNLYLIQPNEITIVDDEVTTVADDTVTVKNFGDSEYDDMLNAVISFVTDERSLAKVMNDIINLTTFKLSQRK